MLADPYIGQEITMTASDTNTTDTHSYEVSKPQKPAATDGDGTGEQGSVPSEWTCRDTVKPRNGGVSSDAVTDVYQATLQYLDNNHSQYISSPKLDAHVDHGMSAISRALAVLAGCEDCPLEITRWNADGTSPAVYRVVGLGGDE